METRCDFCEVGTEMLNITSGFEGLREDEICTVQEHNDAWHPPATALLHYRRHGSRYTRSKIY
jgi:hypothetical protein